MVLTRRAFLRQTSLILASLGLCETAFSQVSQRYQQVLAEPTLRKFALLVGINQYASQAKFPNLQGCLTDVDLQREVLIHRFDFHPDNICVLTDEQATVGNITTAFMEHLVPAGPKAVVLFHFSGYGCQLQVNPPSPSEKPKDPDSPKNALVCADLMATTDTGQTDPVLNRLVTDTLLSLLRSLPTKHVISVLDTGFAYPGVEILGHLRVRSLPTLGTNSLSLAELSLQSGLQPQTQRMQAQRRKRKSSQPDFLLAATQTSQTAFEAQWHDVTSGLFTYALTQHLWTVIPAKTVFFDLTPVVTTVAQQVGMAQQPEWRGQPRKSSLSPYDAPFLPAAEGVVLSTRESDQSVELWLGGVSPTVLDEYGTHTCLRVLPSDHLTVTSLKSETSPHQDDGYLQLQSRRGLTATAQQLTPGSLQVGQSVQEAIRVLPRTVPLNVAMGVELDRIERVDATSAFSAIANIASVGADQPANCLFTKVPASGSISGDQAANTDGDHSEGGAEKELPNAYALCSLAGELLPNTRGEAGEAIKTAVSRLESKLDVLLAAKLLGLTVNHQSSRLGMMVTQYVAESDQIKPVAYQLTPRAYGQPSKDQTLDAVGNAPFNEIATLPSGSRIRYRIGNYSARPLYWVLFGIDNSLNAFTCSHPNVPTDNVGEEGQASTRALAADATLMLPSSRNEWVMHGSPGLNTTFFIGSSLPFIHTSEVIAGQRQSPADDVAELISLSNPLEMVQAIFEDSAPSESGAGGSPGDFP